MLDLSSLNDWTFTSRTGNRPEHVCCTMSAISVLRGEETLRLGHPDICPVITAMVIHLNDKHFEDEEKRKAWALEVIPRIIGTYDPAKTEARLKIVGSLDSPETVIAYKESGVAYPIRILEHRLTLDTWERLLDA